MPFNGQGAQFLPFDFFDGFPALAIELDVGIGLHVWIIAPSAALQTPGVGVNSRKLDVK